MRQAGRSLPEYRERRGDDDILETCRHPEEVVELTLQPLRRMPVDAAILFSDIMVPLHAIGVPIRIEAGRGPVVDDPIRDAAGVARLRPLEPETDEPHVMEAIRLLVKELEVPLIGFAGAPFTLASYLVEGGPSRTFARTKAMLYGEPVVFDRLLEALADIVGAHLHAQIDAGVRVVQLFDSWVGRAGSRRLPPRRAPPHDRGCSRRSPARTCRRSTSASAPAICSTCSATRGATPSAWTTASRSTTPGPRSATIARSKGTWIPRRCSAPGTWSLERPRDVLARAAGRDGHVFNLGHGVLPDTPVEHLQRLVDLVHEETARPAT